MTTRFRIHFRSSLSGCRLTLRMPNNTGITIAYLSTATDTGGRLVAKQRPTGQASNERLSATKGGESTIQYLPSTHIITDSACTRSRSKLAYPPGTLLGSVHAVESVIARDMS